MSRAGPSSKWLFGALLLAALTAGLVAHVGWCAVREPQAGAYPVRGIDVSHHQGRIDWNRLQAARLSFVFIKATEGCNRRDRRFAENWKEAGRIGIAHGAYHFFSFCSPADCQADLFLGFVPREERALPPAVDVEFSGNCRNAPPMDTVKRELATMVTRLREAYGTPPVLYVTRKSYDEIAADTCDDCLLWVRDTWAEPRLPQPATWTFWQYDDRGRLPGISTDVDLNVFRGDGPALEALVRMPEPASPMARPEH